MKDRQYVNIKDLVPGMMIAENVYDSLHHLIIPENTEVTDKLILRLDFYAIQNVLVEDTQIKPVQDMSSLPYSERIKASDDFKEFKADYIVTSDVTKDALNSIIEKNASQESINQMISSTTDLLNSSNTNIHIFDMLHNMREIDDTTYAHSINVSLISAIIGRWMKFPEEDIKILMSCGLFHDVGKLLIPPEILTKPGKLTPEEFNIIKTHAVKGYHLLKEMDLDERILLAAMAHHERCDGSGYPLKLHSPQINAFAKIVSIADVYDAMTSARVYRGPECPFKVISVFEKEGYALFDPVYMLPFLANVVNTYIHNTVLLSNNMKGDVILINPRSYSRPIVKCGDTYIDLSKHWDISIEAIL